MRGNGGWMIRPMPMSKQCGTHMRRLLTLGIRVTNAKEITMKTKKQISQEEFDTILEDMVFEESATLTSIPGVYEAVSEYFNNAIIERWEEGQEVDGDD